MKLFCCTNFHRGEKAKALRLQLPTIYTIHYQFSFLKVQGEYGTLLTSPSKAPAPRNMYKTNLHKAIEAVPKFEERISLFTKKLRLAQYADGTIYDYRLKIAQAVLYLNKLPDDFTQEDIDDYLSMLLDRNRYSILVTDKGT